MTDLAKALNATTCKIECSNNCVTCDESGKCTDDSVLNGSDNESEIEDESILLFNAQLGVINMIVICGLYFIAVCIGCILRSKICPLYKLIGNEKYEIAA